MGHPVYVHIGPPRTGTTSIQRLLRANRDALRSENICIPSLARGQFAAVNDLLYGERAAVGDSPGDGPWGDLTREVLDHDGPSVISQERLAFSDETAVARLGEQLAERDVHVVYTIRDLVAITLSAYLGVLKRGSTLTLDEHVAEAVSGVPSERVWQTRAGSGLRQWAAAVPPERMHVVTVPPKTAPRTQLWERFCSVIGHDPSKGPTEVARSNESVGVVEADFLRRLNSLEGDDWTKKNQRFIRGYLTQEVLNKREGQRRIELVDREARAALTQQTQVLTKEILERGFHVVGDLSDLEVSVDPPPLDPAHDTVTEQEFADLAMSCTRQLVQLVQVEKRNASGRDREVKRLESRKTRLLRRVAKLESAAGG